ncbi:MAG: malate dehydrogenase [Chloroflexota bacterium]|jgi:malate dehydrogenase|nr:malate dehydrogenase [Chloroflexota bacterium]MDP6757268.1 malate dehydrogenase [Chloroflexota bacterium]
MRSKVTVVGAGATGGSTARRLAERGYADVVLVDIVEGFAAGKALDLNQGLTLGGHSPSMIGADGYDETAGSDICVITSGFPRQPGMSRDDLLLKNKAIVEEVTADLVNRSPDCTLIILTNPMDAMAQLAQSVSGFPRSRVIGQGGLLDTARYRAFISWELDVSPEDVSGFVLGGHGDTMVPVPSFTSVAGVPVNELIDTERMEAIIKRTAGGGGEIVGLLKKGSAFEAPGEAVAMMCDAILMDRKRLFPCAVMLEGEYGIRDTFVGVLVKLGAGGMEEVLELDLSESELAGLRSSADSVRELIDVMGI